MKLKVVLLAAAAPSLVFAGNSPKSPDDATVALIRAKIDEFSSASDRLDQAAMGAMFDDDILFSSGNGSVDRDPQRDKNDATSELLKRQTQSFRDAAERGDLAAMRSYLDAELVFVDENCWLTGSVDFKGTPEIFPGAASSGFELKDWVARYGDQVAITSYKGNEIAHVGDQVLANRFLALDTWIKRGDSWKLMASDTIPLSDDPAGAAEPDNPDDYVGAYGVGDKLTVNIARNGATFQASTNSGAPSTLIYLARNVFVSAGSPAGYVRPPMVFKRDNDGRVRGYQLRDLLVSKRTSGETSAASPSAASPAQPPASTLVLRDFMLHQAGDVAVATFLHDRTVNYGAASMHRTYRSVETWVKHADGWKLLASQGHEVLADPTPAVLPIAQLENYAGVYSAGPGLSVRISREAKTLVATASNQAPQRLIAVAPDCFVVPGQPRTIIVFQHAPDGRVSGYRNLRDGRELAFKKGA